MCREREAGEAEGKVCVCRKVGGERQDPVQPIHSTTTDIQAHTGMGGRRYKRRWGRGWGWGGIYKRILDLTFSSLPSSSY